MMNKVIFVELAEGGLLPDFDRLHLVNKESTCQKFNNVEEALECLSESSDVAVIVANYPSYELFSKSGKHASALSTVLVTQKPMAEYSEDMRGEDSVFIDHVISSCLSAEWTQLFLETVINKITGGDIFGLDKYLGVDTRITSHVIKGSVNRDQYNNEVMRFAEQCNLGQYLARIVFGITEELLMNAIYDAPVKDGVHLYHSLPRTVPVELTADEFPTLSYGCSDSVFGVAISDPFGAVKRNKFFEYIKKAIKRQEGQDIIDKKQGGAGIGLFKILYSSHALICNVLPNKRTEFIALLNTKAMLRDINKVNRSINFFETSFL